jgi:hypothetical protein
MGHGRIEESIGAIYRFGSDTTLANRWLPASF